MDHRSWCAAVIVPPLFCAYWAHIPEFASLTVGNPTLEIHRYRVVPSYLLHNCPVFGTGFSLTGT